METTLTSELLHFNESLYESLYSSFEKLNDYQMQFISKIKYIVIHFLYESPNNIINVSSLVEELTNLNLLIKNFGIDNDSKKLEYLTSVENGGDISKKTKNKNKTITKKRKTNKRKTRKIR